MTHALPTRLDDWLFERVFGATSTASALLTLDGTFLRANQPLGDLLGCAATDLTGRPYRDLLARRGGSTTDLRRLPAELPFARADGELVWLHVTGTTLADDDGRPYGVLTQFHDVSARRDAEAQLRESEQRFRVAFEQAPYGLAIASTEGRILQANHALARLLGRDAADLVGRCLDELVLPNDAIAGDAVGRHDGERRYVRPDGGTVWADRRTSVVRDEDGRPNHVIAQMHDVTDRRRQEDKRGQLEEQLRRAQRMEAVGRLAGGIAHDFNNMLAVILNYADFARQRVQDPRTREFLEAIRKAALRSSGLTRQLMIFARRDAAPAQPLELNAVVDELVQLLQRTLGEDIELRCELAADLARVRLAVSHAEQVLMNLTVNARDAMPRGGRLVIGTRNVSLDEEQASQHVKAHPGDYVELTVRDTGVGMAPEVLAVAFEPFFTTKESGRGTGLGLSIVYGIVEEAGGFITVDSAPGEGTTFSIRFPVSRDVAARKTDPEAEPAPTGQGESVLVVEDEPFVRALTVQILGENGYEVATVETPEAALELCRRRERPFDLLLTDVVMPRISGRDLAMLVQALRPDTRVLFMSGHADEHLGRHRVRTGSVAFLQKPFNADDLLRAVRSALEVDEVV